MSKAAENMQQKGEPFLLHQEEPFGGKGLPCFPVGRCSLFLHSTSVLCASPNHSAQLLKSTTLRPQSAKSLGQVVSAAVSWSLANEEQKEFASVYSSRSVRSLARVFALRLHTSKSHINHAYQVRYVEFCYLVPCSCQPGLWLWY